MTFKERSAKTLRSQIHAFNHDSGAETFDDVLER
jgi:hypothetical protein